MEYSQTSKKLSTQLITKFYSIGLNHYYGFSGIVNDWFSSNSNKIKQTIQVGQHISDKANITSGVPQESGFGPLLFLLYVNDILKCSKKLRLTFQLMTLLSSRSLYADKNVKTPEASNIQSKSLYVWLTVDKLKLNTKKSNFILFHTYQKELGYQPKICCY